MYKWIIIGGGIHGCTAANFLAGKTGPGRIKIIDPHEEPMSLWKKRTDYIGMEFLRSPSVHHTDREPFSLQKYADRNEDTRNFYGKYKRPNLQLFNDHADRTFDENNLRQSWYQDTVNKLEKENDGWKVFTTSGQVFRTENVVVAARPTKKMNIPGWAEALRKERASVYHVFEEEAPLMENLPLPVTVIGGGISAAHTAVKLAELYPGRVTLLKRHPFRIYKFDSDPGWLGPKNLTSFQRLQNYEDRRKAITKARYRGSLPKDIYNRLVRLKKQQKLFLEDGEISEGIKHSNDLLLLKRKEGRRLAAGSVLLATGFLSSLKEEDWLQELIQKENLQCARCGYPIVSSSLEWCSHLFVSGPLSELELGPTAGNIAGAQKAAERIAASIK